MKPVCLCCTSMTSPYCPFPSCFPIAKSDFLNDLGSVLIDLE